jgi:hypothetical protein
MKYREMLVLSQEKMSLRLLSSIATSAPIKPLTSSTSLDIANGTPEKSPSRASSARIAALKRNLLYSTSITSTML